MQFRTSNFSALSLTALMVVAAGCSSSNTLPTGPALNASAQTVAATHQGSLALGGAAPLAALAGDLGLSSGTTVASFPPVFDPANFINPTLINNPYFLQTPGTTFVYEGVPKGQGQVVEIQVTHETKTILGVSCVVVRDRVWIKGELAEDTIDWFAQDRDGNVWYMGEEVKDYKNGVFVGISGSWEAGVNGAIPGIVMLAQPQVGNVYRQELLAGEAEDMAEVLLVAGSVSVPYGAWSGDVLVTDEWTPLEKQVHEQKYYARGVGFVKSETVRGGSEGILLVEIRHE